MAFICVLAQHGHMGSYAVLLWRAHSFPTVVNSEENGRQEGPWGRDWRPSSCLPLLAPWLQLVQSAGLKAGITLEDDLM